MTPADILRAAKAVIDTPEKWTRNALARGKSKRELEPTSSHATCWCAYGALVRVTKDGNYRDAENFLICSLPILGPRHIDFFNDAPTTTHADIMALFDRAIAAAEREGGA